MQIHLTIRMLCLSTVFLAVTMGAAAQTTVAQRLKEGGNIVIAHRESSVPFSYLDANKRGLCCGLVCESG
jgi:glutamate/aspartate transport system substrate-binding protein